MKKALSILLLVTLFGGLITLGGSGALAEDSPVFRLYPLTKDNIIDETAVRFGALDFGESTSYFDKEGKKNFIRTMV